MKTLSATFLLSLVLSLLQHSSAWAQEVSSALTWGAFIDTYIAHDFNNPVGQRRLYTTQPVLEDQARVNLGYIDLKLENENYRGRLAFQAGDSVKANYVSEPDLFWRYIQESTLGYKINSRLSVDAGIYLSHIGLESFNSKDNWNYTRSLVADYSPYYQTGAKISYQINDTLDAQFHILRGWQNISASRSPAIGMQLAWAPTEQVQIIYNNFYGDEQGERVFNELLGKFTISDRWSVATQFDLGRQSRHQEKDPIWWHGWAILSQYKISPTVAIGARIERFVDPHRALITPGSGQSFQATGFSMNIDTKVQDNLVWRNEWRTFVSSHRIFPGEIEDPYKKSNTFVVSSISFLF